MKTCCNFYISHLKKLKSVIVKYLIQKLSSIIVWNQLEKKIRNNLWAPKPVYTILLGAEIMKSFKYGFQKSYPVLHNYPVELSYLQSTLWGDLLIDH